MANTDYKPLNLDKLKDKKHVVVSTEEALKDISPINWNDEVVCGERHVLLVGRS